MSPLPPITNPGRGNGGSPFEPSWLRSGIAIVIPFAIPFAIGIGVNLS